MAQIRQGLGLAAVAMVAALVAFASPPAKANLILVKSDGTAAATVAESFVDIGGNGFGHAPRMLTLHENGIETGFETPVDVENGDAIDGADKSTTPTLSALGWTSGSFVSIGFNSGQTGHTGITLQSLVLTIFNGTTAVGTFSLASPIQFSDTDLALQTGNGNAIFDFGLDAAQQAQFNTLLGTPGSSGFFAGLGASLGCAAPPAAGGHGPPPPTPTTCQESNDGQDSFLGIVHGTGTPVPEPASLALLGAGLLGLGLVRRRRNRV